MPLAIEVKDLVKKYKNANGKEAVRGVSFSIEEGESFGFLGPNGAGKTTTIDILCTLLDQTSGTARVNGFDTLEDPHGVRSSIGLVFQEMTLDNELTAYENLKFHSYLYNMERRLSETRIDEMLEVVGLTERKGDFVKTFSGGMKRRLEIARGLLHRPKVLFLDEPTLGLDPQTRRSVWGFIDELRRRHGNTVFMTTHYMDEAESCDRIAIIDEGRIIALDTPNVLKRSLRGDTIYLNTTDDDRAAVELKEIFSLDVKRLEGDGGLALIVESGEKFIPRLLNDLSVDVLSVNLKRPTLDDVFLHMTGKEIRDARVSNSTENARSVNRRFSRR
ncbi:MAG: ATP-binding cassette domain-containing protein [Deltaproteobacteria bacterium]|nr:ATP-binding cassette domain-containing protein [Deltaproteobacteria bacterium]